LKTLRINVETASKILQFAAITANATEASPLKLGNAEFWIDSTGPWAGQLAFFPSTSQWDAEAVQAALNDMLASRLDELSVYLNG
jgi:hypothetical protein